LSPWVAYTGVGADYRSECSSASRVVNAARTRSYRTLPYVTIGILGHLRPTGEHLKPMILLRNHPFSPLQAITPRTLQRGPGAPWGTTCQQVRYPLGQRRGFISRSGDTRISRTHPRRCHGTSKTVVPKCASTLLGTPQVRKWLASRLPLGGDPAACSNQGVPRRASMISVGRCHPEGSLANAAWAVVASDRSGTPSFGPQGTTRSNARHTARRSSSGTGPTLSTSSYADNNLFNVFMMGVV
jgi:hypothetical protein